MVTPFLYGKNTLIQIVCETYTSEHTKFTYKLAEHSTFPTKTLNTQSAKAYSMPAK